MRGAINRHGLPRSTAASIAASACRRTGSCSARRGCIMADWTHEFDEPIPVPKGRQIVTLRDAGDYVAKLPKAEHMTAEWQAAMLALMLVVDLNGPTMMARIGIMRALNRNVVREFDSSRKDTHWGKRKLKRDE